MAGRPIITGIIQSYLRPSNIQSICEVVLNSDIVDRLIVTNNNPEVSLQDYLKCTSNKLVLINQPEKCGSFKRFEIANEDDSDFFFSIDDDLYLTTDQVNFLINKCIEIPTAPHGFWGMNYEKVSGGIQFEYGIFNRNGRVDILNRAYFFTKDHVNEIFLLLKKANINNTEIGPSDDIILSFAGNEKPFIHNIGQFLDCPTSNQAGIAQWLEDDFESNRINILDSIHKLKQF